MNSELRNRIVAVFGDVYRNQTGQDAAPQLTSDTVLLDTGLDSLGFAVLVVTLEQELGYDPFLSSAEAYYPRTFGEFLDFYEANAPK